MKRFLMCSHGAAQVTDAPPPGCTFVGTVAADGERYRVLRGEDKTLYAAPAEWVELLYQWQMRQICCAEICGGMLFVMVPL